MKLQTVTDKVNMMCMCMMCCCCISDYGEMDSGNREAVNLRVRCLP